MMGESGNHVNDEQTSVGGASAKDDRDRDDNDEPFDHMLRLWLVQ
jgi:hypothetical protein